MGSEQSSDMLGVVPGKIPLTVAWRMHWQGSDRRQEAILPSVDTVSVFLVPSVFRGTLLVSKTHQPLLSSS